MTVPTSLAIEGTSDEGACQAILAACGAHAALVLGRAGKAQLLQKVSNYNRAAAQGPWLVLVDLDNDHGACAAVACREWLPSPLPGMCFRIAVREMEAWLLADAATLGPFLGVSRANIPLDPEGLEDPKQVLINLARRSSKRRIREGMVPRAGSGSLVGPTYVADVNEYARSHWRPEVAASVSPSLGRCLVRLGELAQGHQHLAMS